MRILGTGSAVPANVLTNEELSRMVDTSDEWIRSRTGIQSRHIATDETAYSLAHEAAEAALVAAEESSGFKREQVGLLICATVSNELRCPSVACQLQSGLGLREDILAFDLNGACTGFVYALILASRLVCEGSCALVVGCELLSRYTDFTDRNTCVLFGDAAGAAVVAPPHVDADAGAPGTYAGTPGTEHVFEWVAEARGNTELLYIDDYVHMDGQGVFKFAVEALSKSIQDVVAKSSLGLEDVDLFVCHQANERIIGSAAKRLGLPLYRFYMNLATYGNTSAASIPLALDEAVRGGAINTGDTVVLAGFGGGLTAGSICLTWQ